jgi:hypothetical protein
MPHPFDRQRRHASCHFRPIAGRTSLKEDATSDINPEGLTVPRFGKGVTEYPAGCLVAQGCGTDPLKSVGPTQVNVRTEQSVLENSGTARR